MKKKTRASRNPEPQDQSSVQGPMESSPRSIKTKEHNPDSHEDYSTDCKLCDAIRAKKLEAMTDTELCDYVESEVATSAIFSSRGFNNWSLKHHYNCTAAYREADRRGKPELYERGYNRAAGSFGYR